MARRSAVVFPPRISLPRVRTNTHATRVPLFLPDFSTTNPGYSDAGLGHRYFHAGKQAELSDSMDCINAFLNVMGFDTVADRANAIAAALTAMLPNH